MNVEGLDRVVIATPDLGATTERFATLLGVEFTQRREGASGNRYCFSAEAGLEILTPPPEGSAVSEWVEQNGTGLYGVTVSVSNLEEAISSIRDQDVEPISRLETNDSIEVVYHPEAFAGILVILRENTEQVTDV